MRTFCGQSDGKHTNQSTEIPRAHTFSSRRSPHADYYNRLESGRLFRLLDAAMRARVGTKPLVVTSPSSVAARAARETSAPQAFLSLSQGRESSHMQLRGVTPLRKGTA
jgi:hypothetical protein